MGAPKYEIRVLGTEDADAYVVMRREALLQDPYAFGSSPEDDLSSSLEFVQESLSPRNRTVFAVGAIGDELMGSAALLKSTKTKFSHKAQVIAVYVRPAYRGFGIGKALIEAIVQLASEMNELEVLNICVSEKSPEALGLYKRIGFVEWGREPNSMRHGDERVTDIHMSMFLADQCDVSND